MGATIHLLLVTDRQEELDQLQQLLAAHTGVQLEHSGSRADAGQRLRGHHFDAVLLCSDQPTPRDRLLERWLRDLDPLGPPLLLLLRKPPANIAAGELPLAQLTSTRLLRTLNRALEQRSAEQRLLRLAQSDPLTGLASPVRFQQQLRDTLARARRSGDCCALLYLDLDQFAPLNHRLGPDAGDDLLARVGERLADSVRDTDLVARLGSDDFAVIATGLRQPLDAALLAQDLLRACRIEGDSELGEWRLEASVGIALFPNDADGAERLQQRAAEALAAAQRDGVGFRFADSELDDLSHARMQLRADIGHALLRGQMELRYQPLFDLRKRQVARVEVLLRWRHPLHGLLAPHYFLPLAESSGAIHPLGSWALRKACEQRRSWRSAGLPALPLSFNIANCQLERDTLANGVRTLARDGVLEDGELGLELDEAALAHCGEAQRDLLTELHGEGVHLTLDQFAGERCTLAQLRRLPLDALKIGRSFTAQLQRNGDSTDLEALLRVCRALRCDAVATGVERAATAAFLNRRHCDQIQGFFVSRPLTAEEFPAWMRALEARR